VVAWFRMSSVISKGKLFQPVEDLFSIFATANIPNFWEAVHHGVFQFDMGNHKDSKKKH